MSASTAIVAIDDIDVSDDDDTEMQLLIVTLTDPQDGTDEYLSLIGSMPSGIGVATANDNQRLIITGAAPKADYATVISMIHYHNISGTPSMLDRTISMYVNDGGTESNISSVTISMSAAVLPVEFIDISAKWEAKAASLQWITAAEEGVSHFEIERSVDTRLFQSIGQHPAIGGRDKTIYQFQDPEASKRNHSPIYYRVKSIDFDGQTAYSSIVELNPEGGLEIVQLSAFPNPATDFVEISATVPEGEIQIVDINGSVLWKRTTTATEANVQEQLNIQTWARGIYFVRAVNPYSTKTQKIVVQ